MSTRAKPIVCLGILVADIVARPLNALPERGRLVLVDEMGIHTGGCATNAASALARLGLPVEVIGKVGSDLAGDFVVEAMQERGIGTRGVRRDPQIGTSLTIVLVDPDGERRFVHYLGANAHLTLEDLDLRIIEGASILHIGGALVLPGIDGEPTAELLRKARAAGVVTFLDIVWDDTGRWLDMLAPCLPWVDYFIPSLPEAQVMTGLDDPLAIAHTLLARGPSVVGLKLGAQGCLVLTRAGEIIHAPAFQVNVVDATGAGDAFAAGFIAGVWQGWPLEKTARFANAVGALCVTGLGAGGGVRSLPETLQFMETTAVKTA
ncbi:MAG TPA: carbohydrate kinase family protein [Anaerolineales bacterium]|nr:carbohydrate kinase family protein [Anaerolineales bacterium]